MQKLIDIPSSIEIEKLNNFAISFIGEYLEKKSITNWSKFIVILNQKVGHGTRMITSREITVELNSGEFQAIQVTREYSDINLLRVIRRILKRTKQEEVTIEIIKDTSVKVF